MRDRSACTITAVQAVDLAHGPLDPAALQGRAALMLYAAAVDPPALVAALVALQDVRSLKELRLFSRVRALPRALTELRGLQRLVLVDPDLPGLPREFSRLTRLRSLRLELFHLASLPHSFGALTRLRELSIDSHHLCGLPDSLRALEDLRSLTLRLHHDYVHDWEHPAHFPPRFVQPLAELFALLAALPALSSLTLAEPNSHGMQDHVFDRLPREFADMQTLETLNLEGLFHRVGLPHDAVMPAVRRIMTQIRWLDATATEVQAMFPNATFSE